MAYSDYGGYAFRNGMRVEERSDFTINPDVDGGGYGTPGSYPGFALVGAGMPFDEIQKESLRPKGHAVIGDGPLFVTLYKQTHVSAYLVQNGTVIEVSLPDLLDDNSSSDVQEYNGKKYLEYSRFVDDKVPAIFRFSDGTVLTVFFLEEDNYYCYARLEQSDGNIWHAWSGYGVGAGLEDCGYGFSTEERTERCEELFSTSLSTTPEASRRARAGGIEVIEVQG